MALLLFGLVFGAFVTGIATLVTGDTSLGVIVGNIVALGIWSGGLLAAMRAGKRSDG